MARKVTGFKNVAKSIAKKQGISKKAASAILASSSRKASAKAKRKNPKLKKSKMRKLSAWLLKAANWISDFWERCKCKWNKALLFISMTTKKM